MTKEMLYELSMKGESKKGSIFIKKITLHFVAKNQQEALFKAKTLVSYLDSAYRWGYSVKIVEI